MRTVPSSLPLLILEQEVWAPTFCPNTLSLLKANLFLVLLPPSPHSLKKSHSSQGNIPGLPFHSVSNLSTTGMIAPHPLGTGDVSHSQPHTQVRASLDTLHWFMLPWPTHSPPTYQLSHSPPGHALFPKPEKELLGPRASQTSLNPLPQPQQIHIIGGYSLMTCSCEILSKVMNRAVSYCRHCFVCLGWPREWARTAGEQASDNYSGQEG